MDAEYGASCFSKIIRPGYYNWGRACNLMRVAAGWLEREGSWGLEYIYPHSIFPSFSCIPYLSVHELIPIHTFVASSSILSRHDLLVVGNSSARPQGILVERHSIKPLQFHHFHEDPKHQKDQNGINARSKKALHGLSSSSHRTRPKPQTH
jgi:hypothetical protein